MGTGRLSGEVEEGHLRCCVKLGAGAVYFEMQNDLAGVKSALSTHPPSYDL